MGSDEGWRVKDRISRIVDYASVGLRAPYRPKYFDRAIRHQTVKGSTRICWGRQFRCSFGSTSDMERGDVLHGHQPVLHISSPRHRSELASHTDTTALQTGQGTPASPCGVDTTRGATVTGYKPSRDWRKARRQGLLPTVGGIVGSHWTAVARLKLGSTQTVRCCPSTVCDPHWVHGD